MINDKRKEPKAVLRGKKFSIRPYNAQGDRFTFSTKTSDAEQACAMCQEFHELYQLDAISPMALGKSDLVYEAYFGHQKDYISSNEYECHDIPFSNEDLQELDNCLPAELHTKFMTFLNEYLDLKQKALVGSRSHVALQKYKQTATAREIDATERCPEYQEALDAFKMVYESRVSSDHYKTVVNMNLEFAEHLKNKKPVLVETSDIRDFLERRSKASSEPTKSRRRIKALLSVFFKWSGEQYGFTTPFSLMDDERKTTKEKVAEGKKKRGITWHDLPVIEGVLDNTDTYWTAVIATMAYAGVGLTELSGIRNEDFIEKVVLVDGKKESRYYLSMEWHDERGLKAPRRADDIPVDENYLLPRLLKYLKDGHAGSNYLFAKPRKYCASSNTPEMWTKSDLSKKLNGRVYPGGKRGPAILPANILARDLRHTFGSLLIRSGYSVDQACALTRNGRDVFLTHYGCLLAEEMKVEFTDGAKKLEVIKAVSVLK